MSYVNCTPSAPPSVSEQQNYKERNGNKSGIICTPCSPLSIRPRRLVVSLAPPAAAVAAAAAAVVAVPRDAAAAAAADVAAADAAACREQTQGATSGLD